MRDRRDEAVDVATEQPETPAEPILFYFDFLSPYGYLGSVAVERLAARLGHTVEWRPILLGVSVLKVMGLKALTDTPLKREYVHHDVARFARLLDVPFRRIEAPMQPLAAMRAFTWLAGSDPALAKRFGQAIYRAQWAAGADMSSAVAVCDLAVTIGIDGTALLAAIESRAVKDALRVQVASAIEAGIFGVPTFVVDGEMFWGADRLPMVERWIETGGW